MKAKLRSELECAAYHEAAHTVIARVFSIAIDFVSIDDMGGTLLSGVTAISFHDTVTTDDPNAENKMMLAGPLADIRFARLRDLAFDIDTAARDYWRADCRVVKENLEYAQSPRRANAILSRNLAETIELVEQHWPVIECVAKALIKRKTLDASEIETLLTGGATTPRR